MLTTLRLSTDPLYLRYFHLIVNDGVGDETRFYGEGLRCFVRYGVCM